MIMTTKNRLAKIEQIHEWANNIGLDADGTYVHPFGLYDRFRIDLSTIDSKMFLPYILGEILKEGEINGRNELRAKIKNILQSEDNNSI